MDEDSAGGPTFERFIGGWVVVDRSGTIATPTPMTDSAARAYARLLRIDFPGPPAPGTAR